MQPQLRWSLTCLALFALVVVASDLPLPARAIALVPVIVAVVVTIQELLRQRREDAPVRMRLMPVITLVLLAFVLVTAAGQAVFYESVKEYQDCMSGANTAAARAHCELQRQQSGLGAVVAR